MADITASSTYRIMDLHESERPRERLASLATGFKQRRIDCHSLTRRRDRRERSPGGPAFTQ
jgi:hypothetical protein